MWTLNGRVHTRAKLRILADYLHAWATIIKDHFAVAYYVDGFAGAGSYDYRGIDVLGSPGIGATVGRLAGGATAQKNRCFELRCRFVEANPQTCVSLRSALTGLGAPTASVLCGRFGDLEGQIVSEIRDGPKGAPAFFFIDPYGIGGLSLSSVRRILALPHTEALVNLNLPSIRRHAGQVESLDVGDALRAKAEQKLRLLFGDDSWQDVWRRGLPTEREEGLLELYASKLNARFRCSYRMCRDRTGKLMYYLVHATNNDKGASIMGYLLEREQAARTLFPLQDLADVKGELVTRYRGTRVRKSEVLSGATGGKRKLRRALGELVVEGFAAAPTWGLDDDEEYTFFP